MKLSKSKIIFAFLVFLSTVLGTLGYKDLCPKVDLLSCVYLSIGLFFFDTNHMAIAHAPWALELARWLSPVLTLTSVIAGVWYYLHNTLQLSRLNKHDILFGEGVAVENLLNSTPKKNNLLLLTSSSTLVEKWKVSGGVAIKIGERMIVVSPEHLQKARIEKASNLFLLDVNDKANLRAALLAQSLTSTKGSTPRIIVRQDSLPTRDLIQRNDLLVADSQNSLRVVSIEVARARQLLMEHPLEWIASYGLASEVYLALPKLNTFEEAVAIQAALIGHYANGGKVHLWLSSENCCTRLLKYYPYISQCLHLHKLGDSGVQSFEDLLSYVPDNAQVTILATDESPESGFVCALRYKESRPDNVYLKVILSDSLSFDPSQLKIMQNSESSWLGVAPTPDRLNLLDDNLDKVAQQVHETWREGNRQRIENALSEGKIEEAENLRRKPTYKPWHQLTEYQKDSNRTAADHIEIKIRAVGLDPEQSDLEEAWGLLNEFQIDILARMEHCRWVAQLLLNGYQVGERNDDGRTHPDLVPYDQLDQSTKDYDVEQVREAVQYYLASKKH